MKLIHMADLHIGKTVNGFSMLEDQVFIFGGIIEYMEKNRPDVAIISGDIYDKPAPGADAVKVFDHLLTSLADMEIAVFIISGNHDSPERLGFAGDILQNRNIYLSGVFEGTPRRFVLKDSFGEVTFHLLPFIRPVNVRRFYPDARVESYQDAIAVVLDANEISETKRNILISHQLFTVEGEEAEHSESEIGSIGGIETVDAGLLSPFDYVALGHLHGPQKVGEDYVRYAGSPLKYSASECNHKKSMVEVELREKGDLSVRLVPLNPRRDMRKIIGPIAELTSPLIVSQGNREDYLHITLTDEKDIFDAIGRLREFYPNIMTLSFDNRRSRIEPDYDDVRLPETIIPYNCFAEFYESRNGAEMTPEQARIVRKLLEETREGT